MELDGRPKSKSNDCRQRLPAGYVLEALGNQLLVILGLESLLRRSASSKNESKGKIEKV